MDRDVVFHLQRAYLRTTCGNCTRRTDSTQADIRHGWARSAFISSLIDCIVDGTQLQLVHYNKTAQPSQAKPTCRLTNERLQLQLFVFKKKNCGIRIFSTRAILLSNLRTVLPLRVAAEEISHPVWGIIPRHFS